MQHWAFLAPAILLAWFTGQLNLGGEAAPLELDLCKAAPRFPGLERCGEQVSRRHKQAREGSRDRLLSPSDMPLSNKTHQTTGRSLANCNKPT